MNIGLNVLEDLYERLHKRGKFLVLSGPHTQPLFMMDKAGFLDRLGRENVCANIELSLARAREILGLPPAPPSDPLHEEKQKIEMARQELTTALERAGKVLNGTAKSGREIPAAKKLMPTAVPSEASAPREAAGKQRIV